MSDPGKFIVRLPDGAVQEVALGTTVREILRLWRPEESATFLAANLNGVPVDLDRRVEQASSLAPLSFEDRAGRDILQHSAAHLVAKALTEVIPTARPTHGPPTDEGFFYDFEVRPLTPDDLEEIRRVINRMVRAGDRFERREISKAEAEELFATNPHKLAYLHDAPPGEPVSVYSTGDFVDLCRGPHVPDTHWLEGVHVLGFSAVQGKEGTNPASIQRVRGVGFPTRALLDAYLKMRKEAEARDHRIFGSKLQLFMFLEESPGSPVWLPNGMIVVRELERFVTEHLHESGYSEVRTPLLFDISVYQTSGHWEHYRENMFLTTAEDRTFAWKPMNCPGSMLIFRSRARSYRELPLRLAEFAPLHRNEASGTLHGMTRVREFVQDDAHLFVSEDQIEQELRVLMDWVRSAFTTFQLEWSYELSTRPATFLGEKETWDRAEATLEKVLRETGVKYRVSPGEGAFYGPKIDIHIRDSMGRPWQTGTIQLDYQMPIRFGLEYQGADGQMHVPVVIHRVILGSWERFFAVLLEHCNGRLPPWLSPVQVRILPVTDRQAELARGLAGELRSSHLRVEVSDTLETLPKRVRQAEVERVPYIAVLGDQELTDGSVALRIRGSKGSTSLSRAEFIDRVSRRVRERAFEP